MCVQFFVYIVGLCATYISNFNEYEATRLASFQRYINIVYLSGMVVLLILTMAIIQDMVQVSYKQILVLLLVVAAVTPKEDVYKFLSRATVEESMAVREPYNILAGAVKEIVPGGSRVYLVSQETNGFDYWVLRYSIRPVTVNPNSTWSIGIKSYEGDIWTRNITAQTWREELISEYDFVALYKINDYFQEHFAELFQNPSEIQENTIYKINKSTGFLEKYG